MPQLVQCLQLRRAVKANETSHLPGILQLKSLYIADRLVNLQYQKYPEYVLNNFQNLTLLSSIIYLFPKGQFHENLPIYFILLHRFSSHSAPLHYAPHQCDLALAPLLWLQVLANTESPSLRCKAAVDRLIENTALHEEWPHCTIVFLLHAISAIMQICLVKHYVISQLVSWSLTSLFSTNMAISETKGQGWKVIRTQ